MSRQQRRDLAQAIRATLNEYALSQNELARRVGIGSGTISQILNSEGRGRVSTLRKLAYEVQAIVEEASQGRERRLEDEEILSATSSALHGARELNFSDLWADQYHFLTPLGHSGYSSVWLADECDAARRIVRQVAIRVFVADSSERALLDRAFDEFLGDVRFLADFASDNPIVQFLGYLRKEILIDEDGIVVSTIGSRPSWLEATVPSATVLLLIMEYADGGQLGPRYRDEVIVKAGDCRFLDHLIDICSGLKALHEAGIVHRDIKPSSLLWFRRENQVKIGDFGVTEHLDETAQTSGVIVGSLPYMSPESFDSGVLTTAARDIYALGCTFYELLTGEQAFCLTEASSAQDHLVEWRRCSHRAPRPSAVVKSPELVSIQLSELIRAMMDVDPTQRPSLDEIIRALQLEKERRAGERDTERAYEPVQIPAEPICLTRDAVNPEYRTRHLKESAFFIFLSLGLRSAGHFKRLFAILNQMFADTYSIIEVFGQYDFVIRVWAPSNRIKVTDLCNRLVEHVLEDDMSALWIMPVEDMRQFTRDMVAVDSHLDEMMALLKLKEAQAGSRAAAKWLRHAGIYHPAPVKQLRHHQIRCFWLVSKIETTTKFERASDMHVIIDSLQEIACDVQLSNMSVYRRAYQAVDGIQNERADILVTSEIDRFEDAIAVSSLLVDTAKLPRCSSSTLISTKRFFVDSDRVLLP